MSASPLLIERDDGLAIVTLNRPQAMNALTVALRRALAQTFAELEAEPAIRVVILTGAGRAFCAGLDLKELASGAAGVGAPGVPEDDPAAAIAQFSGPVIGAINGVAITGGFEVALACDVLLGSSAARFADTHARVAVHPAWGLSQRLQRIIGLPRAKELSLTGNFLDAERAERWGLLNRVVEPDELLPTSVQLARDMLGVDPAMLKSYKRLLDDGGALSFGDAMALEAKVAIAFNASLDPAALEARRQAVQARGRDLARD
ncbi:MAG: enoyl-CoA hydratase [Gammaproteobacteria bacterium]|nr:enoyl-CoA hydratase [Gammaproteobacteria bacterium]